MALLLCAGINLVALAEEQGIPELDVAYEVYRSGMKIANMQRKISRLADGRLLYRSETKVVGLARIFRKDHIIEQSTWRFTDGKLIPELYEYSHTGRKKDRNVSVDFDWEKKQVSNLVNGSTWQMPATEGMLDKLLYQYSIMRDMQAGKSSLRYVVADGGPEKLYVFESLGEEVLDTQLGKLKTIKMVRHFTDSDRQSIFWSAPDLGYLPVKLENIDDGVKTIVTIHSVSGLQSKHVSQK